MLATGMVPTEESVAASTMKPLPVTPARALRGEQQHGDDADLVPQCQLGVRRLGKDKASGSVRSRAYIVIQGTEVCLGHFPGQVDCG